MISIQNEVSKALADPTRRQILRLLSDKDMSAGEIAQYFDMTKPPISHHLSILKDAGLILDERQGQSIIYSLNMTLMQDIIRWFFDFTKKETDKEDIQ